MSEYTQEQIEEAIETLKKCTEIEGRYKTGPYKCKQATMGGYVYVSEGVFTISLLKERDIILAALEAATKDRDDAQVREVESNELFWRWKKHAEALTAYAAKLEKAGDALRESLGLIGIPEMAMTELLVCNTWDAARKEKP